MPTLQLREISSRANSIDRLIKLASDELAFCRNCPNPYVRLAHLNIADVYLTRAKTLHDHNLSLLSLS